MSFKQKTWNDRISEHPTRRTLTDVSDNTTKTVDVAREEGTISQEGDAYSAANMNDLESRIAAGFSTLSQDSLKMSSSNPSSDSIKFGINANGQYGYIKQGASEVTPFRNPTGNASPSDVLSGKTFSTASLENASGTRVDLGSEPEMKGGTLYNGDVYLYPVSGGDGRDYGIRRGVHASPSNIAGWSGGTLFTKSQYDSNYSSGYNRGVTDADNRANSNSTNYKSGYNAGYGSQFSIPIMLKISSTGGGGADSGYHNDAGYRIKFTNVKSISVTLNATVTNDSYTGFAVGASINGGNFSWVIQSGFVPTEIGGSNTWHDAGATLPAASWSYGQANSVELKFIRQWPVQNVVNAQITGTINVARY